MSATRTDEGQAAITNTFLFDSLGGKIRETDNVLPAAWVRTAQYEGRGLLAKTTTNTTSWARAYDALGRLDNIKVGTETTALAKYTYAGFATRVTRALQNGLETRSTYDELGRQTGQSDVVTSGGAVRAQWVWAVPLDGVPRRADLSRTGAVRDNGVYAIDAGLRVLDEDNTTGQTFALTATTPSAAANATALGALGAQAWDYDLDGRSAWIDRVRGTAGTTTYTRDARDALTRVGNQNVTLDARGAIVNDGSIAVVYDALGQASRITAGAKVRTYQRDALGRVISETDQTGAKTRFGYDGPTRVVRQRSNGTTFDITIDGAELDEHVATITGTKRQFLHQDRLGSVYLVSSAASPGVALEWVSYSAYGEATVRNAAGTAIANTATAVAGQFGFNGLPHDFLIGTVDMRARVYRPVLGRFLSPDPLGPSVARSVSSSRH